MDINITHVPLFDTRQSIELLQYPIDRPFSFLFYSFPPYRRTADVRSVGYAELFSLSREDVLSAMKDYPEAEVIHPSATIY